MTLSLIPYIRHHRVIIHWWAPSEYQTLCIFMICNRNRNGMANFGSVVIPCTTDTNVKRPCDNSALHIAEIQYIPSIMSRFSCVLFYCSYFIIFDGLLLTTHQYFSGFLNEHVKAPNHRPFVRRIPAGSPHKGSACYHVLLRSLLTLLFRTQEPDCRRAILCNIWSEKTSLTHWGRDKMAAISQTTFSNTFSWMKMYEFRLRFHWSLF